MPNDRPLPGHWSRDDGKGSAEVAFPTGATEVFEDEQPLASSVPITEPTEAEKAAQLVARTPVPIVSTTPSTIAQALTELELAEAAAQTANLKEQNILNAGPVTESRSLTNGTVTSYSNGDAVNIKFGIPNGSPPVSCPLVGCTIAGPHVHTISGPVQS